MDGLLNLIRREVARCMARYAHPVAGIITSYDPVTHAVKVQYQPEGALSGWIPLNTPGAGAAGLTAGIAIGPHIGQALIIGFLEGDRESPFVMARMFTESEIPAAAAEGDIRIRGESGSRINVQASDSSIRIVQSTAVVDGARIDLLTDGSVTVHDKSGAGVAVNGLGRTDITGPNGIVFTDAKGGIVGTGPLGNWSFTLAAGSTFTVSANGSSIGIDASGNLALTLAAGKAMNVNGAGGAGVSIDGSGNCLVNGATVLLGGATGTKKVALDGDLVVAGAIVASSTIVRAK